MSRVVHFEIPADDMERAVKFYESVFGWEIEKWDDFDYWLAKTGEDSQPGINGAIMPSGDGGIRNTITVDSYDEAAKKIVESGGEMLSEKMEVPGVGFNGLFRDSEGNELGIIELQIK
jgi:predicted enzyme related to lactoylglutathione lyase